MLDKQNWKEGEKDVYSDTSGRITSRDRSTEFTNKQDKIHNVGDPMHKIQFLISNAQDTVLDIQCTRYIVLGSNAQDI